MDWSGETGNGTGNGKQGIRPIFGIFEGGGAKGIAHLGAVAAAEESGLGFIGVAGASAGAIVAALLSVGYSADELMTTASKTSNLLATREMTPLSLFGDRKWRQFLRLLRTRTRLKWGMFVIGIIGAIVVTPRASLHSFAIYRNLGHFSPEKVRSLINALVRERLISIYAANGKPFNDIPERIRFRDLDETRFPEVRPLKVVAADIDAQALVLFDRRTTPDVEIGEAVAASVAIPFVFRPATIPSYAAAPTHRFADGGLVSNLPVWVFADEKLAYERANPGDPRVPVVAFQLVDPVPPTPPQSTSQRGAFIPYLTAVGRSAVFGGQSVSQKFLQDLLIVKLRTKLPTLGFDATWMDIKETFESGKDCATLRFKTALSIYPDRIRAELKRVVSEMAVMIDSSRRTRGHMPIGPLRSNLVLPVGSHSLRVTHAYNMDADADDRLLLDKGGRGAGAAFTRRTGLLIRLDPDGPGRHHLMTKYERCLLRPSLRSIICMPVFAHKEMWRTPRSEREEPIAVLCIDSDEDLIEEASGREIRKWLIKKSQSFSEIVSLLTKEGLV